MYCSGYAKKMFSQGELPAVLRHQLARVQRKVALTSLQKLAIAQRDTTVQALADELRVRALVLHRPGIRVEEKAIRLAPSPAVPGAPRAGPIKVPGRRFTAHIPYSGDPFLWQLAPFQGPNSLPAAQVLPLNAGGQGRIKLVKNLVAPRCHTYFYDWLDLVLADITVYLRAQQRQIDHFNCHLAPRLRWLCARRWESRASRQPIAALRSIALTAAGPLTGQRPDGMARAAWG